MRTASEIAERINELKASIHIVEEKMKEELSKELRERNYAFLKFLHKEKDLWSTALLQIEWVMADN